MIKSIAHIAFQVNDMEASLKFYETFGIKKAFSISDDNGKPQIEYLKISDGQFIELFYSEESFESLPMWKKKILRAPLSFG
jgi:predicted lactoylglutathione lyase